MTGPSSEQSASQQTPDAVRSSFADDPDMQELVEIFVDGIPDKLETLQNAVEQEDLGTLRTFAHQLKGASGGYGFETLVPVAHNLEQQAESASSVADITSDIDAVIAMLRAIRV